MSSRNHVAALSALLAALLVIGLVAHEVGRHLFQALPAIVCLIAALSGVRSVKWAAFAVYGFWSLVSVLIWLFLLHIANIAHGRYSPAEIAMTVVLTGAGLYGVISSWRQESGTGVFARIALLAIVVALQFFIMSVSFKPPFAHDAEICARLHLERLCALNHLGP
jgi:hypothetical protein